jgi:hypothetical protein
MIAQDAKRHRHEIFPRTSGGGGGAMHIESTPF